MFRPKWLGWHALMVVTVLGMLALGDWQFHRAEAGNGLSWAYTFEWPIFAGFAIVFWAKTIKDEFRPPARAEGLDNVALPAGRDTTAGAGPVTGPAEGAAGDETTTRTTRNWPPTTPIWPGSPPRRAGTESGTGSADAARDN